MYKGYGYSPFKMSKFEEYDLYVRNKDFLIGENVITFNDTDGRLLALKPDVTLSIIRNTTDNQSYKVYYNENVYRVSARTHQFKEIMQTGIECIGDIDLCDVFEVVYLAAKSLDTVCPDFILDISHMGLYSAFLDRISEDKAVKKELTRLIAEKNKHEALRLAREVGLDGDSTALIEDLISLYGDMQTVLSSLEPMCKSERETEAYSELKALCTMLSKTELSDKIRIDFSLVTDMRYYGGIIFKGFLSGICEDVLSGGSYAPLMRRMGRKSGAIGFALYVDLLEELDATKIDYDVDVLLLYDDDSDAEHVIAKKRSLLDEGKSVYSSRTMDVKIRYRELVSLRREGENND